MQELREILLKVKNVVIKIKIIKGLKQVYYLICREIVV